MPQRSPKHIGVIPDGNRRWAVAKALPKEHGYRAGLEPGYRLLSRCEELGVEEVSIYGFTRENTRRPSEQVAAFRATCVEFATTIARDGRALLVIGDSSSSVFPDELRTFTEKRSAGSLKVNFLVNYGWQWDVRNGMASRDVSRVDLVIRWGGRSRLSGFLPLQSAYADIHVIDSLWPDATEDELRGGLEWYARQDVTLGG